MYTFPRASDIYMTDSTSTLFDDVVPPSHFPSAPLPPPFLLIPDHVTACTELDMANMAHSHSSSSSSSYSSPSYVASQMQRSISSHSLEKNDGVVQCHFMSNDQYLDMDTSPVRRVFSTGDLHRIHMGQQGHRSESPLASESNAIIEGMSRTCRYSPEEKKERIERYRSKRTQRNFNKKIKYACRKTLADSRPRIRGRFARNDEIEKNPDQVQWRHVSGEEDDEYEENWINYIDSVSSANLFS